MINPALYAAPVAERCFGTGDPLYENYHDSEWGRPVATDTELFERLSLEAFQSGLSWITILRKRDGFRAAFEGFDPSAVAQFTDADVERLLTDAGIVRNRRKIEATIANASTLVALQADGGSLTDLLWSQRPTTHQRPESLAQVPPQTAESAALSKALKRAGFRFVGPTTAYAAMQACGIVNDHLLGCPVGDAVEALARPGV